MLRFIVDWVGRKFATPPEMIEVVGHAAVSDGAALPVATPTLGSQPSSFDLPGSTFEARDETTASKLGIRFQRDEFGRLLRAIGHWETVEFFTANGTLIESIDDVPKGADGGIDAVIRIVTATEHGARVIAGRIRKMIVRQSY